jgi:hypothetical protein
MGVVNTREAVIGMLLMAGHGETVEIAGVAVAIGTAATGENARMDAAVEAAGVGAAVIGTSIGGRAAISLPRTRRAAAGARARDVEKVKGVGTGIGAMRIAVIPVGATEIVTTSTEVKAIALRAAVVRASAPTEIGATATALKAAVVMVTAVKEVALRVVVVTVTVAREIAPRVAVAKATVARAVVTSIAMPIAQATSTAEAAMLANPVRLSVRMSKLIVPPTHRWRCPAARVMPA